MSKAYQCNTAFYPITNFLKAKANSNPNSFPLGSRPQLHKPEVIPSSPTFQQGEPSNHNILSVNTRGVQAASAWATLRTHTHGQRQR